MGNGVLSNILFQKGCWLLRGILTFFCNWNEHYYPKQINSNFSDEGNGLKIKTKKYSHVIKRSLNLSSLFYT